MTNRNPWYSRLSSFLVSYFRRWKSVRNVLKLVLLGAVINIPGISEPMTTKGVRIIHYTDFFFTNSDKGFSSGGLEGLAVAGAVTRLDQGAPTSEGFNFAYDVRKGRTTDLIALNKEPRDAREYYSSINDRYKEIDRLETDVPTHIIAHTPTFHGAKNEIYELNVFVGAPV
jgi:hypothetical protein